MKEILVFRIWMGTLEVKKLKVIKETDKTLVVDYRGRSTIRKNNLGFVDSNGELFVTNSDEGKKIMSSYLSSKIDNAQSAIERYKNMLNSITGEE